MKYNKLRISANTDESATQDGGQSVMPIQIMMPKNDEGLSSGISGVEVENNKIYFYCPVSDEKVLALHKVLQKVDTELQILAINLGLETTFPIELHINSPGGDLFSGFAAYDYIRRCKNPVHTYVDGVAASAASIMSCAGKKRFITENSWILIHQLSQGGMYGTHENYKDTIINQSKMMEKILNIYKKHTNIDEKKLKSILKRDLFLPAEKCLEFGLVDKII